MQFQAQFRGTPSVESLRELTAWRQPIKTPHGMLQAVWTPRGLFGCSFGETSPLSEGSLPPEHCTAMNSVWYRELEAAFQAYFSSGVFAWNLERLDWTGVTEFRMQVLKNCYEIPSGQTLTYGQLAERVGRPGAARAVGSAMATNRWPLLIPCHRVIGAGGGLVGYSGTGGLATKESLLELERSTACRSKL